MKNLNVSPVGLSRVNCPDEGDLLQDVFGNVPLVKAPVCHSKSELAPVEHKEHDWHGEQFVDFSRQPRQLLPRIGGPFQFNRKK